MGTQDSGTCPSLGKGIERGECWGTSPNLFCADEGWMWCNGWGHLAKGETAARRQLTSRHGRPCFAPRPRRTRHAGTSQVTCLFDVSDKDGDDELDFDEAVNYISLI